MTEALYMDKMFETEFDAVVKSVSEGKFIVLDKTLFYPKSGGVDCDTGIITNASGDEYKVVFVGKFGGNISHQIDVPEGSQGLKDGDHVHGKIDWDRRYKLMRYHTSAHLLSAVFQKETGAKITGNNLTLEKGRIDFSLDNYDKEKIIEYIEKANEIIKEDLPVEVYSLPRYEVEKNPDLCKLAKGLPPGIDILRIVDIKGYDAQPDGGCHVKSLKEVGKLVFLKADNKGAKNRRVSYVLED